MAEMDTLAGKVFALLKGNGLQIKIFDTDGAETVDPDEGRRFFVSDPNIMVTIDEEDNCIQFSKGESAGDSVDGLQKNIRKLADEFLMNSNIKVFGRAIQPRDYAYQAKMQKGDPVMENTPVQPVNHHLLGQVINLLKSFKKATAATLADQIGVDLNDAQRVLNRLVKDGKVQSIGVDKNGYHVYSLFMEEAIVESPLDWFRRDSKTDDDHMMAQARKDMDRERSSSRSAFNKDQANSNKMKSEINRQEAELLANHRAQYEKEKSGSIKESFSKMFGSNKTSHQTLENVRILVKHKTPVDENVRGSRSRHISAIFLECNGERLRFSHTYLPGARAMAQHLSHGGTMSDKVGLFISESTGQLLKLQAFNRYVTVNKLINEDSSGIIETIAENINILKTELKKLTGIKTYEMAKARLETFEKEPLAEDDLSQLKDIFTIRRFDEKFEEVLPIVNQLLKEKDTYHKRIEEAASNIILLRSEMINTIPMFEFASENARLGFKISEFSLRMVENSELSGFINKIGTKLCKEGTVNNFERAILMQVFENSKIADKSELKTEIKESVEYSVFFDRFDDNFM